MTRCIYCNYDKEDSEFSQEHIIPASIGGKLQPTNPFSTKLVCKRCNNISGFFIDAPFSKSWVINNYRSEYAATFATITSSTILPLTYMGVSEELKFGNKICEVYLGPTGDSIYHFHEPYPEEIDVPTMVGVPPHLKKKEIDHGFAFLFLASNNPAWIPTIFYSFIEVFKKAKLFFGNGPIPKVEGATFFDIPQELQVLHQELKHKNVTGISVQVQVDAYFETRFIAKVALGLGCIFLNESFKLSDDAQLLRKFMWTKSKKEREKIPLYGTGIIPGVQNMKGANELLKWEGGHVIGFMEIDKRLILYTNFYGQAGSIIQISANKKHWDGIVDEGLMFIIVPAMQKYVGPIHITELLASKYDTGYIHTKLSSLQEEMLKIPPLPPFKIENKMGSL